MIGVSEIKPVLKMPEVIFPAVLVMASVMSLYVHRNIDKFKRSMNRLKEALEYEAMQRDSSFEKYKVSMDTAFKMKRLGWPVNYNTFLATNAIVAVLISSLCLEVLENSLLAVIAFILWMLFAHQMVDRLYRTRVKAKIDSQAQLVLQLLAEIYTVSDNLPQAIERVIPSTPHPLRGDLEKLVMQVKTNEDINQCLVDFAVNIDSSDIETFVHGIILSDQFGADAHEVITKNAEVIRDRIALREELLNETKGKKAIIGIFMVLLPVVFLWLFIGSEDAREVFTSTAKGHYITTLLVIVEYLCWYFDSRKGVAEEL